MLVLALLAACSRPPDAPKELDDLVGFMFAHTMDEENDYLAVGGDNLAAWMDTRLEETLDGYAVNNLTQESLDALDDQERTSIGLLGAAVGHASDHTPWELAYGVATYFPTERNPDRALTYERPEETDRDCFLEETCSTYVFHALTTTALPLGIETDTHIVQQMRWFEMADGSPAFVEANFMVGPAEVNVDWLEVIANYYVWVSLPEGTGSRNMYATWADTRISGSAVPESLGINLAIDTMQADAVALDAWMDAHPADR